MTGILGSANFNEAMSSTELAPIPSHTEWPQYFAPRTTAAPRRSSGRTFTRYCLPTSAGRNLGRDEKQLTATERIIGTYEEKELARYRCQYKIPKGAR